MTFSWIGFKIIILETVKKFARDRFIFKNYCLGVPCARIWGSVISITSNVAFFIFINKPIKSILKSEGPKLELCGTPCSILDLSLKHSFCFDTFDCSNRKKSC